ncbi:ATP synthase F1 subunit delta [Blattabacterium cuenoti]|uniref:ATP synthase F1 subunit delta n=1 Tax=Blattabacterium cuenoti TaxID=1653831 RepID=UPI00163C886E|nr:ATP synthase F1 subunit delta [Blattabacterium cuenoti]
MFLEKKIIEHYAKILFESSSNLKNKSSVYYYKEIKEIYFTFFKNIWIKKILSTHLLTSEKKIFYLEKILFYFDPLLCNFIKLVILKKREILLKKILFRYKEIYEENEKNMNTCIITTSIPLDKKIKNKILKKTNFFVGKNVKIINKIDKSIIGGFLIQTQYKKFDFSIKNKLEIISKKFN